MEISGQSRTADNDVLCLAEPGFERKSTSASSFFLMNPPNYPSVDKVLQLGLHQHYSIVLVLKYWY
jgi:hypothetical protein